VCADVYTPLPGGENANLGQAPYLGPHLNSGEGAGPGQRGEQRLQLRRGDQLPSMGRLAIASDGIKSAPRASSRGSQAALLRGRGLYFDGRISEETAASVPKNDRTKAHDDETTEGYGHDCESARMWKDMLDRAR